MNIITVATYACLSLYGTGGPAPKDVSTDRDATLEYRESGPWIEAPPLWYDARPVADKNGNEVGGQEYRGSVCGLKPGTKYELRVTPNGAEPVTVTASTWPDPPVGKLTMVGNVSGTYRISESGTPTAWRVFEGGKIDAKGSAYGVIIDASYVILRGFTVRNASQHGILLGSTPEPNKSDVHDVVIERSDISAWGSVVIEGDYKGYGGNLDSAIFSYSSALRRITVQRNTLHDPNFSARQWVEKGKRMHPRGPQAITFNRNLKQDQEAGLYSSGTLRAKGGSNLPAVQAGTAPGNHVIRYNDIWASEGKRFNDAMGSFGSNGSNSGFLIRDTDIYGNRLRNAADDMIEGDGAYRNVRIWGNYFDDFSQGISFQGRLGGPAYVWANVFAGSTGAASPGRGGAVFKHDDDGKGSGIDRLGGRAYLYHNATVRPPGAFPVFIFLQDGAGGGRVRNVRVYNNILVTGDPKKGGIRMGNAVAGTDLSRVDHNLIESKPKDLAAGAGTQGLRGAYQAHGAFGAAKFIALTLPAGKPGDKLIGDYRLAPGSPGTPTPLAGYPVGMGPAGVYEYGPLAVLAGVPPIKPPPPPPVPEQCTCPCPATP